jgi:peptidoglycan hydrolase-like protein with peptidoglycan-binding domain
VRVLIPAQAVDCGALNHPKIQPAIVVVVEEADSSTFGDYDNDGFADIYLTNLQANILYHNNGNGTFKDVTEEAGVGDTNWSSSAGFADYDNDGDLDLYVCNYISMDFDNLPGPGSHSFCFYKGTPILCGPRGLVGAPDVFYRNNGDGSFTDVTEEAQVVDRWKLFGLGVLWADVDDDRDLDLYVANDDGPNLFYLNNGDGTFQELGLLTGLAVSMDGRNQGSMGVDMADYDNDSRIDAFLTHFASDYSTLYRNKGKLQFEDVTGQTPILKSGWHQVGWGTRFLDFDHDTRKDLLIVNGHVTPFLIGNKTAEVYYQPMSAYQNLGGNNFKNVSKTIGRDAQVGKAGRGAAFGDFDNDGDTDLLVANLNDTPSLFRSDLESQHHWVMFRTRGVKTNRDGIGARITVVTGETKQIWEIKRAVSIYSASDPRAHFGLAAARNIDLVKVEWPSGTVQEFTDVRADRHYLIHETEGIGPEFPKQ